MIYALGMSSLQAFMGLKLGVDSVLFKENMEL
jgi:hypothetical protein